MHIVVIGGGWAGISAAIHAAKRGWRVSMVEARPYVGGRARSFTDRETGAVIDNGQHVMIGAYTQTWEVLTTLGTHNLIEKQTALKVSFADTTGTRTTLDASGLPGKAGMVTALLTLQGLSVADRISCLRLATRIVRKQTHPDTLTCEEFLIQERQTPTIVQRFWEPLILATLNAPIQKAAAALLVNVMRLAFLGGRGVSSLWIPTRGLSELLAPFPTWLAQHGGTLYTSCSVESLTPSDKSGEGGLGIVSTLSNKHNLHADAVISTIPQRALQRLLDDSAISANLPPTPELSPIVSVYLWYDKDWLTVDFTAALGTSIQWVFNKRTIQPGLVALTVSAAHHDAQQSATDLVKHYDAELRSLFPEMRNAVLQHHQVIKEKHATPLITPAIEQSKTVIANNNSRTLVIAGDWTVSGLPATIEAAARSGANAVAALAHLSNAG